MREPIELRARSRSRIRGETACHAPWGAVPPAAGGLTPPATSGEELRRDTAHVPSTSTWEVAQKAIATFACARSQGPATSVRSALPRGVDAPERLRRGRSKRGAARPSSNLPAEHGPREALASRESPAQVPRHQPARHPHAHVRPAERLNAYKSTYAFTPDWRWSTASSSLHGVPRGIVLIGTQHPIWGERTKGWPPPSDSQGNANGLDQNVGPYPQDGPSPRLRGETASHAPWAAVPPVAEGLTPPATSGEEMQRDTAHVPSTST